MIIVNAAPKHGGYFLMRIVALMGYKHYEGAAQCHWPEDKLIYGARVTGERVWRDPWPDDVPTVAADQFIRGYISRRPIPHEIITISRDPRNAAISWLYSRLGSKYNWERTTAGLIRLLRECGEPVGKKGTFIDFSRNYLCWFPDKGVWMEDLLTDGNESLSKVANILGGSSQDLNYVKKNAYGGENKGLRGPKGEKLTSLSSWSRRPTWKDWRTHPLWTQEVTGVWKELGGATLIDEMETLRGRAF